MTSDKLRSLVQQAFREIRIYEKAVIRADEDPTFMPELLAAQKKWLQLERQIIEVRLKTPDLTQELKIQIKKLDDAIDTLRERELLVIKGQVKQAETLAELAQEMRATTEQLVEASQSASAKIAQIKDEALHHTADFCQKWLSERNLTEASLTEEQRAGYEGAVEAERIRWIRERFAQLDSESKSEKKEGQDENSSN